MPDYGRAFLMQAYVVVVFGLLHRHRGQSQKSNNPIFRLPLEEKGEETKS